ncbi:unnamed protein product [Darwinula stevensoni]|uniref:F-actin binding domain-containing protein n=1 Tax=Darwinula stevensoni TaxID=69355 RepID=A0A7R8ZWZ3_9CRUS|nr:unnamed protein product [Darwinula stevensoni]CAG0878491.1 unnamed protein product [Darwinula stevensoni]
MSPGLSPYPSSGIFCSLFFWACPPSIEEPHQAMPEVLLTQGRVPGQDDFPAPGDPLSGLSVPVRWASRENLLQGDPIDDPQLFFALYDFLAAGNNQLSLKKESERQMAAIGSTPSTRSSPSPSPVPALPQTVPSGPSLVSFKGRSMGGGGGVSSQSSQVIQMRKVSSNAAQSTTSSKKVKQAPVPPKRTSSFRDSSVIDGDSTGEPEGSMEQSWDTTSPSPPSLVQQLPLEEPSQANHLAKYKRGPALGNRGMDRRVQEQKPKKAKTFPPKEEHRNDVHPTKDAPISAKKSAPVQVAALEVQNVRRAINRYGTLPKNARIGAYLESLRQSGLHNGPGLGEERLFDEGEEHVSSNAILNDDTGSLTEEKIRAKELLNMKTQAASMIRSNSSTTGFPLKDTQNVCSPKQYSLSRPNPPKPVKPQQVSPASLEFPPPPAELPPPQDEEIQTRPIPSPRSFRKPVVSPLKSSAKSSPEDAASEVRDREADKDITVAGASRFGVSLRSRGTDIQQQQDASIDSCDSAVGVFKARRSSSSDVRPDTQQKNVESGPMHQAFSASSDSLSTEERLSSSKEDLEEPRRPILTALSTKNQLELRLVSEIKEKVSQKNLSMTASEHMKPETASRSKGVTSEEPHTNARKNFPEQRNKVISNNVKEEPNRASAKPTQLWKSRLPQPKSGEPEFTKISLRRVDDKIPKGMNVYARPEISSDKAQNGEDGLYEKPQVLKRFSMLKQKNEEEQDNSKPAEKDESQGEEKVATEDRRVSTGSINSLRKLWEKPVTRSDSESKGKKPSMTQDPLGEKPSVPTKPSIKPAKPSVSPMQLHSTKTPPVVKRPMPEHGESKKADRDSILELFELLEKTLVPLKGGGKLPSASLMPSMCIQLSDKISLFHSSCSSYADQISPHSRFHFRELLSKLENQAQLLRSAANKNCADNSRICSEILNTLKDLVNAVQR